MVQVTLVVRAAPWNQILRTVHVARSLRHLPSRHPLLWFPAVPALLSLPDCLSLREVRANHQNHGPPCLRFLPAFPGNRLLPVVPSFRTSRWSPSFPGFHADPGGRCHRSHPSDPDCPGFPQDQTSRSIPSDRVDLSWRSGLVEGWPGLGLPALIWAVPSHHLTRTGKEAAAWCQLVRVIRLLREVQPFRWDLWVQGHLEARKIPSGPGNLPDPWVRAIPRGLLSAFPVPPRPAPPSALSLPSVPMSWCSHLFRLPPLDQHPRWMSPLGCCPRIQYTRNNIPLPLD